MKTLILLTFFLSLPALAENSLSIYTLSPDHQLDWSSPGKLLKSLLKSRLFLTERPYGTVLGVLQCQSRERYIANGTENFDVIAPLLFQGQGLGYFFATHLGEATSSDEAKKLFEKVIRPSEANTIKIMVSTPQCERMEKFLEEFDRLKIGKSWGLPHRPLMAEGATSASLVAAVAEVGGILSNKELDSWKRTVSLPKNLCGNPIRDQFVVIFSLFGPDWGQQNKDSIELSFWDPVLIREWIGNFGKDIDRSKAPVPEGNFWKQALEYGPSKN